MPVAPLSPLLLDLIAEGWDPPWNEPRPPERPAARREAAPTPTPASSRPARLKAAEPVQ